jgi:hypothetical protein
MAEEYNLNDEEDEDKENLSEAEYSKKAEYSKPQSVQEAVRGVVIARAKEMREGYWNCSVLQNGMEKKVYIGDTRKEFIGSVLALKSILSPEIKRSKVMQEVLDEVDKKLVGVFEEYAVPKVRVEGEEIIKIGKKYIPEMDEDIPVLLVIRGRDTDSYEETIVGKKGYWNYNVRQYWNELVLVYDYLFAELNNLIDSPGVNYFKQKSGY